MNAINSSLGVVDKLFARVGASDNVANHQSTFHVEMSEMAHILCNATPNSFVILDEIGICMCVYVLPWFLIELHSPYIYSVYVFKSGLGKYIEKVFVYQHLI